LFAYVCIGPDGEELSHPGADFGCFVTEFKGMLAALRYGAAFGVFGACDTLPGRMPRMPRMPVAG